jgi:hypothetical protein
VLQLTRLLTSPSVLDSTPSPPTVAPPLSKQARVVKGSTIASASVEGQLPPRFVIVFNSVM